MASRLELECLIDCAADAYTEWLEECVALEHAYRRWAGARGRDATVAFAAYRAGLDREERASILYAELVRRVEEALSRGRPRKPVFAAPNPQV
jgi:hypothetical protein